MKLSLFQAIVVASAVAVLCLVASVEGQFFTKTSKSIPRMGRRADDTNMDTPDLELEVSNNNNNNIESSPTSSSASPLSAFVTRLMNIPRYFQEKFVLYNQKLRKRSVR